MQDSSTPNNTIISESGDHEYVGDKGPRAKCIYSPNGKKVAFAISDEDFSIQDADDKAMTLTNYTNIASCVFSPDSKLAVVLANRIIKLKDVETGAELKRLEGHEGPIFSCVFSPDCRRLTSASLDRTIRVWDVETGRQLWATAGHCGYEDLYDYCIMTGDNGWVNACAFSPDGTRVVSASNDRQLGIWDAETGREIKRLIGHTDQVRSCAYSPDGKLIASASWDETVKVWDAETGKLLRVHTGYTRPLFSCIFTPDCEHIVSLAWDDTVRVREVRTGNAISTFTYTPPARDHPLNCLGIAGNREIAVGDEQGIHHVFSLPANDSGIPLVTAARLYSIASHAWDSIVSVFCPWCGTQLKIDKSTVSLLREINYTHRSGRSRKVPESTEKDPRLIMVCPHCQGKFRLTTYLVDNAPKQ